MNKSAKTTSLLFILIFLLFPTLTFAQEAPPDLENSQVLKAKGAAFSEGWNFFTLGFNECTAKNVLDELQADGGSALRVDTIFTKELFSWQSYSILTSESQNKKIGENQQIAFNSNQKFFLEMDQKACLFPNSQRQAQIDELREGTAKKSIAEKITELPVDLWAKLMNLLNNDTAPETSNTEQQTFENLTIGGKTTVNDLGVTGSISSGLLRVEGLSESKSATINTLSGDLFLQNQGIGGINILGGLVTIDKAGRLTVQKINVDVSEPSSSSLGSATLRSGSTFVDVSTSAVSSGSKIFVTLTSETGGQALIVKTKTAGSGFRVIIEKTHTSNISFDWFIIN